MSSNSSNREEYRIAIDYYIFREDENYIAYCPSLDISTSGKDYVDAIKNFYERFQIYIDTCVEMGTMLLQVFPQGTHFYTRSKSILIRV